MKRLLMASAGSFMLLLCSVTVAQAATFSGEVMDSACAKMGSHEGMMKGHPGIKDAKGCTLGCVKNGAKFVLYDPATKSVYQLDDQDKPMKFAGDKVKVSGTLDKATMTIHVKGIKAAA